jgi:hypothetical protein
MPRSKKRRDDLEPEVATPDSAQAPLDLGEVTPRQTIGVVTRAAGEPKRGRMSLPLTDSGAIDWSGVRESRRSEIRETLRNDPVVVGMFAKSDGKGLEFQDSHAELFLNTFAVIEANIFKTLLHLEPGALRAFQFTPEHHAELDPQLVAIGNKYGDRLPAWMLLYKEELLFGVSLGKIVVAQVLMAKALQNQIIATRLAAERAPIRPNGDSRDAESGGGFNQ